MKKIERFQRIRHEEKRYIYLETGVIVRTDQLDQLESTIEELVGMLVENLKFVEETGQGWNYYEQKQYLETLTSKTWDNLKELTND